MATGAVHTRASMVLALPTGAAAWIGYDWWVGVRSVPVAAGAMLGCLTGIFLTPDLDIEAVTGSEWTIIKWTLGLGWLWVLFWWPYAWVFHHRSIWSHLPILSTVIRLLYVALVFSLWWWVLSVLVAAVTFMFGNGSYWLPEVNPASMWAFCMENFEWAFGLFFGLAVSDFAHWLMDAAPLRGMKTVGNEL